VLTLLVLLPALALVACSSGSEAKSSNGSTASSTRPAAKVAAAPSAGCRAPAVAPGEEKVTIDSGGTARWYWRHVPPTYDGKRPTPVVLDLHGYAEGADIHRTMSGLGAYGDTHGFITITPQGQGVVPMWDTTLGGPDLAFVGQLLDQVDATLCVDDRRVFVTGLSNGAFMTSAVACQYSDRVAAAAPVAGIRDIDGCKPARPVPVIAFHGTADEFVAYDGGFGKKVATLPTPDGKGTIGTAPQVTGPKGPTIPEITTAWAVRNGCARQPKEHRVASDVVLSTYRCPADAATELYTVEGGGHAWPGSAFSQQVANVVGRTTTSIDATELMWQFFDDHPRPPQG